MKMALPSYTPTDFAALNGKLLEAEKYSDLTIKCGNAVFKVHCSVVCPQSKPFTVMADGTSQGAFARQINLPDDCPHAIKRMIQFLYTGNYSDRPDGGYLSTPNIYQGFPGNQAVIDDLETNLLLLVNTKVYIIADKWNISSLKQLAALKYYNACSQGFIQSFSESLKLIFEETGKIDPMLKDIALKYAGQFYKTLLQSQKFSNLCERNGPISVEVLKAVARESDASETGIRDREARLYAFVPDHN